MTGPIKIEPSCRSPLAACLTSGAEFVKTARLSPVLRQAAAGLPSAETLEKILRYETKLERQLYPAMIQLERLQRMRQGEAIPALLTMEVSERA